MTSPDDDVFIKLAEEDMKVVEELENVIEDYDKTMEILHKRRALYRKYYTQPLEPVETEIIMTQDKLIQIQMYFIKTAHDLQTDIAKLTSRVDDLESKL